MEYIIKILPVGDCHVAENQSLERFKILSDFIVDHRPDHLILMGDFLTLNCFSSWDLNKRAKMEGRRYWKEIEAGNTALDLLEKGFTENYHRSRLLRKKPYKPTLTFLMGNHEDRLRRYLEHYPELEGTFSIENDLHLADRGYEVVPYMDYVYINDIGFTHIPMNKVKPISGFNITHKAQMVTVNSVVFGHTHELHVSNRHCEGMAHLQQTLNCGCFFEEEEDYSKGKLTQYWKGLCLLHSYKPGRFDLETHALGRLQRTYTNDSS